VAFNKGGGGIDDDGENDDGSKCDGLVDNGEDNDGGCCRCYRCCRDCVVAISVGLKRLGGCSLQVKLGNWVASGLQVGNRVVSGGDRWQR